MSFRNVALRAEFALAAEEKSKEASQRSLQDAPIFRLLLKVAVKGTHQCDYLESSFLAEAMAMEWALVIFSGFLQIRHRQAQRLYHPSVVLALWSSRAIDSSVDDNSVDVF